MSASLIQKLPPHVIQNISAGEIIDRPLSVMKELIENSIDAQSTHISIEVQEGGLQLIKVSDDGIGITQRDAELVFARYATSKISTLDDLLKLHSFGFRGEALYSISAVADITLSTKHRSEDIGTEITMINGTLGYIQPIGHKQGTTISVTHLFHRMKVRHQHVDVTKEAKAIKQLILQYALMYPEITFQYTYNNSLQWTSVGTQELSEKLQYFWNLDPQNQFTISHKHPLFTMEAQLAVPQHFAKHQRHQIIAVNGRPILSLPIRKAVEKGFTTFQHAGVYPRFVLKLDVNPHLIDVNIHPQKKKIAVLQEDEIVAEIAQVIEQHVNALTTSSVRYTPKMVRSQDEFTIAEETPFRILGHIEQVDQTYLIANTTHGILLIDQHASDERLWYNRLLKNQKLLSKLEKIISQECREELDDDIYQHSFDKQINAKVATIACHQAIRAGQPLSQAEATTLIDETIQGGNATLVCPHGRPTHLFITLNQLRSMFRRT